MIKITTTFGAIVKDRSSLVILICLFSAFAGNAQKNLNTDIPQEINCATYNYGIVYFGKARTGSITVPRTGSITVPKGTSPLLDLNSVIILNRAATILKSNPECKLKVEGHGAINKLAQQLSWDRVNAIVQYLIQQQGISSNRLIFSYGTEGDSNRVNLMGTTEEGPNSVPAPHPDLRGK